MISLFDSPQFKSDYKKYQEEIKQISNEEKKNELTKLLIEFVEQVKLIDRYHNELQLSNRIPTAISEARSSLASCKKKLDQKLLIYKQNNNS
jgi:flagellar biosynthesis chaperone FliJ